MTAPIRIAINGFGRIGRSIMRLILTDRRNFEVVVVNDVASIETLAYLFKYDSVFGPFPGNVDIKDGAMIANGVSIPFCSEPDISAIDLKGCDLVLECTGMAETRDVAERGLRAGAGSVLISGPSNAADLTFVMGANDSALRDQKIVSNASCTTNAMAPLLKALNDEIGIESGQMTTVHCYTGSQPTVDLPRANPARSRAAALSMVPTTTSAARLIDVVLPELSGKVEARALRVPTASVSCIDLTVSTTRATSVAEVNSLFENASKSIEFGVTSDPVVSTDMRARPESIVMMLDETSVSNAGLLRVFGWYDNEWGFSNRMLDVAERMANR